MHNFEANYNKILETLQLNIKKNNFIRQKRKPKLSDIELIAIGLTAEYMSIDSEHQLFRELKLTRFNTLIDISTQSKGIYLIKVISGNAIFTQKIIYQ